MKMESELEQELKQGEQKTDTDKEQTQKIKISSTMYFYPGKSIMGPYHKSTKYSRNNFPTKKYDS